MERPKEFVPIIVVSWIIERDVCMGSGWRCVVQILHWAPVDGSKPSRNLHNLANVQWTVYDEGLENIMSRISAGRCSKLVAMKMMKMKKMMKRLSSRFTCWAKRTLRQRHVMYLGTLIIPPQFGA